MAHVPSAHSAAPTPNKTIGTTQTTNVYPSRVAKSDWEGYENVLSPDLSDDALYQDFSKQSSAYLNERSFTRPETTPTKSASDVTPAASDAPQDVPVESGEVPVEPPPLDAPQDSSEVTPAPAETESVEFEAAPTEPVSVLYRVSDVLTPSFAFVTREFTFAQESVVLETVVPEVSVPTSAPEDLQPSVLEEVVSLPTTVTSTTSGPVEELPRANDVALEETSSREATITRSISLSDFSTLPLASGQFIRNIQLRASLAGRASADADGVYPSLEFSVATPSSTESIGSILLDGEVSNALNGGSYLFAFPTLTDTVDLRDTTITVTYEGSEDLLEAVYLDAVWLEIEIESIDKTLLEEKTKADIDSILADPEFHTLLSDTVEFTENELPHFSLRYNSQRNIAVRFLRELAGKDLAAVADVSFVHEDVGDIGVLPKIDVTSDGLMTIQIEEKDRSRMRPGEYTVVLSISEGSETVTDSFAFQWGMLSVNSHKTSYAPGAVTNISMGALSPNGNTVCDAALLLYIIDPSNGVVMSQVTPSGECNGNNVIDVPDYSATFVPQVVGEYEMYLERVDTEGNILSHTSGTFLVDDALPLSIERDGPSRIFPKATYPMSLTVHATEAWSGTLVEVVPADFVVTDTQAQSKVVNDTIELSWEVDVAAGGSQTFSYSFDAPDISPFLYSLGAARLEGVTPQALLDRQVKAPDAAVAPTDTVPSEEVVLPDTETVSEPEFIVEPAEPTAAPAEEVVESMLPVSEPEVIPGEEVPAPEVSPVEENAVPSEAPAADEAVSVLSVPDARDFLIASGEVPIEVQSITTDTSVVEEELVATAEIESKNTNVAFTEHRQWQIASDATGSMIVYWTNAASIPAGWTCLSCGSGTFYQKFVRGGATYNTTGGAATHTHTASGTVNASTGANSENGGTTDIAIVSHSHTYTPTITASTSLPAYRNLRVIQNNSAGEPASLPAGVVLMFDGTLPAGWTRYSALDSRYPRGETTIASLGTSTHRHTISGSTNAAAGTNYQSRNGGTQVTAAAFNHTHVVSSNTGYVNHEPPYVSVIFATSSSATSTPTNAVAMWTDTPPAQWQNASAQAGDPFFNNFIKGSATYGTTGGSVTHTHADVLGISTNAAFGTDNARSGSSGASNGHIHAADVTNFTTGSNLPPYLTAIFGKKYGPVPLYTQSAFRFFANTNASTPTDAWPVGSDALLENEVIDVANVPVKNTDVLRIRMQLSVSNSTSTAEIFKLQFATTTALCSDASGWTDVGNATSSVAWRGYNNAGVSDGATLSSSTLSGTDVFGSYEETNPSVTMPNTIGIAQQGEWDFVVQQNGAAAGSTYCFRMVESDGTQLFTYGQYPTVVTNDSPNAPDLTKLFDNEKVATTTPDFQFSAADPETNDVTYQIQVDDDYAFGSVNVDKNSVTNSAQFENLQTPADKDPFTQGELIAFDNNTALTNGTTYYWRARAKDPTGSNAYGDWSTIYSFTVDTSLTFSTWHQTTDEQFDTNTLNGVDGVADQAQLKTGSTTGTMYSDPILFAEGAVGTAWGSFTFADTETSSDLKYTIQYNNNDVWTDVPDSVLSGNAAGFDTSPVSLLGVNKTIYAELRIKSTFTNSGASPSLQDWAVTWAYLIETPEINAPFSSEKVATTTPTFEFTTTDPQGDALQYQIQWSTTYAFTASTTRNSNVNAGFTNITNGADTDPFNSGDTIQFKVQPADALTNGTTYWWRVRARDPLGSNAYSFFTDPQSFTVDTTVAVSTWFQTTQSQFDIDTLSNTLTLATNQVTVATSTDDSLIAYAEGTVTTPRYRVWDGNTWGTEDSALDVGAAQTWVVTKSSPLESEYILATMGSDADVNVQVFKNGAWGNLQEVTASIASTNMRGFDVAYEQSSGDAMVVTCDGDANPTYYIWNGSSWTNGGAVGLTGGNTCGWVKLIADPVSDEIIAITRDTSGIAYEARVWTGAAWGNSTSWGSTQSSQPNHEGIAAAYEESGNQAVVAVSNGTASSFTWLAWNGTAWSTPAATSGLGDDFESGEIVADVGSDAMALCYHDEDGDIGAVRWTGAAWAGQTELETAWTNVTAQFNDRPVDCAFEVGGARDGYIMVAYSDTTNMRYRSWNGAVWAAEASISTLLTAPRVQLARTRENILQVIAYDAVSDRYDYSDWNGTTWSAFQTLETNGAAGASPYKEPFMIAEANPSVTGTAIGEAIDFYDGSGPYWKQMSWTDTTGGSSEILYQVEYYNGTSWALVPNSLLPGNSAGTTTSPINLANILPVATYNQLRPVANMSCIFGVCPSLADWTVTWAAGITISGTAKQYDQSTNVTSGTVGVAINGVIQTGKTGTISGGTWSIANVNTAPSDVVTVFVTGAADASEAVLVTRYDGVGDITGAPLFERHTTIGSDDAATVSNTDLALYDFTNTEDVFFDVNGTSDLTLCATTGCADAELYIKAGNTFAPGTGADVTVHDLENNGTFTMGANTVRVGGSWDNNATTSPQTSTLILTATSTSETFDETGAIAPSFYNLTFGETSGTATWTLGSALNVDNTLTVSFGTLSRGVRAITIARNLVTGASGVWAGLGTTTFDGTVAATWSDASAGLQNIGNVVVDGTTKTVSLGSNVKAQSLTVGADDTFDLSTSNYGITVYGNWIINNTFNARSGTVTMAATSTGKVITAGGDAFYNLTFSGSSGGWSFTESTLSVNNNFALSNGTVTMPTATSTIAGSFLNTGGTFAHNNSVINFTGTGSKTLTLAGTAFTNAFYNVRFSGSGTYTFSEANATTSNDMRIAAGTVVFPSTQLALGGSIYQTAGAITAGSGTTRFYSTSAENITVTSSLASVLIAAAGPFTFTNTNATLTGNLTVNAGSLTLPSGTLSLGGSLDNNSTLVPQTGTVLFNSTAGSETIALGASSLYNATFNSANGIWNITESATTTNNATLTAGTFTLTSGRALAVGATFTNAMVAASTTWTGTTLALNGSTFSINTKAASGDAYDTLFIAASADVAMWNSSAATVVVNTGGSLYSQDNAAVDGDLYVYGTYTRTSGTEYWSYATDFDGTNLGGSSRQVDVKFASGATAAFTNATLSVVGSSTATTTVSNQGSGTYTVAVTAGTTTASYYSFAQLGVTGVSLLSGNEVTSLGYGVMQPGTGGGTGFTISSTTIDANPGLQIYNVNFATTSAIAAKNVTQSDGAPTSYWWFRNSSGNLDGEANDQDTGNPGSIRWDDSSLLITVSGTVYSDAGTTPLVGGTCDGATNVVRVVVEGGATYNGTCSNVDGSYTIGGVAVVGDPTVTVFLNDAPGGEKASLITKTPTSNIASADLYTNRIIVRHEDAAAMTIADMNAYDAASDSDVRFVAATSTSEDSLTVLAGNELYVWSQKTFTPGGSVTIAGNAAGNSYDGSLYLAATSTFTGYATTTYIIGGTFTQAAGASFIPASSTVVMNATTSGKAITAGAGATINFNNLSFIGTSGAWNINSALSLAGNMNVAAGTVTGTSDATLLYGSLSGNGLLSFGGGTVLIARSNTLGGTQGWTFNNLTLGNGTVVGTTTPGSSATTTVGGVLTIANAHFLDAGALSLNLSGAGTVFVETGTFLEDTSTVRYSGASASVKATGYHNLVLNSTGGTHTYTATGIGIAVGNVLVIGGTAPSTFNLDTNDTTLAVIGDVTIASNGTLVASNSGSFTVGGSWDNNGVLAASGGTITFSSAGVRTIAAGASSFATARITGTGTYTVSEHATATVAFSLVGASGFTLASGQTLAVGGTFSNYVGGAATTWTGSTLSLYGGGNYLINPATTTDSYATMLISASTHIRSWNSDMSSINVATNSSLYSMDHANVAGDLYIYGDYRKTSGADHWSYATDFDGAALGGSSRKVDVFFENGATAIFTGSSQLSVAGAASASTSLQRQSSGTYALTIGGTASTTMGYYEVFHTTTSGLTFAGSAQVHNLSHGYFEVGATGGSAITVGGTAITASPARTFTQNTFATSTGVLSAVNVTATGTAVSSWRFTNHQGVIDGEAYDSDPDGDPGYIVWDNSAAAITISGRVYSDEGSTVSTNCDGATSNVVVRVAGLTTYTSTCNAGTGAYAVSGVTYSPGDSIMVYLDGESVGAAAVTVDPVSNINNMDLYERRVIVRHEGTSALVIDDMVPWDSSDDADIPFTAVSGSPDTLALPANYKLLVWTGKTFAPGGNVTVAGGGAGAAYDGTVELQASAVWTSAGTQVHTIGGSLIAGAGATWTPGNSTTTFTTTGAARTIDINNSSFYNVAFTGAGSWTVSDTLLDVQTLAQTAGTLTLPAGTTTISGSFNATGGSFTQNGPFVFDGTGTQIVRLDGSNAGPLYFIGAGTFTMSDTNATSTGAIIKTAGALTLPAGVLALGGGFENRSGTVTHSSGQVRIVSAGAANLKANGSDLSSVTFTGGGTFTMQDASLALLGTLNLNGGTLTLATSTLSIGGSFTVVSGTFNHASGTVLFNSSDTGETITLGASAFYNAVFASPTGGWTIAGSATTTNNFTLTTATSFTQQTGTTLAVRGVFTNSVGGAATTWTGSTLRLVSGSEYEANTKSTTGDRYQTLVLGSNTDVSLWNSAATTTTVAASASLYSQDHAAVDGALNIYGDYHIGTTTEYWSYATDFDGTALGGSSRAVTVSIAQNATTTVDGGTLNIAGTSGNKTAITNQGSGTYAFVVNGGTYDALYYTYRNLNINGLVLSGTPTIASLTAGDFELAVSGGSLISLSSTTLNANASLIIAGVRFATTTAITGYNVSLTGSTSNAWTFVTHTGNLAGEAFDIDGATACGSVRFDDSSCLLTQQMHYRWRNDDGGSDVPNTEWYNASWNKRQRVRVENSDATTYTDAVVKLDVAYDADMQADFDDLRFTDASGTTTVPFWIERYTASTDATVWVKVPSLSANDISTVFMYYNNAGATSTASSTDTFVAADDFEDAGISEYSGNTTLFDVDGSFAYGGSYGLDNTGDEANFSADGIARFDTPVSQGQTLRFMQYVSTGTGDETCTLFGVQSPVTSNNNYAVCLEQVGIDRVSLVRGAERNDSTGTLLASTTITYATGWYVVEVRWDTNDDIDVAVYKDDVLEASLGANDGVNTSGGFGFTYWYNYGGWDNFTARPLLATEPTVYFGTEQIDGGASWAGAIDTTVSGFEAGDVARLRLLIENSGLTVSNQEYQLEYAPMGLAPSCEAVSGASYAAVPPQASCGTSPVCMQSSTFITDGDAATDLLAEASGTFTLGEVVEDPSNTADPLTIDQNEYTELEYAITPTVNTVDENLCFRATHLGDPIDTYLRVAKLSLRFDPVVSNVVFNDGATISLLPGTTTRVYATGTVTDLNGYADFSSGIATSTMFTSSSTAACSADNNDCYIGTTASQCSYSACSGNSCTLVCSADFYYHANPTDDNGTDWFAFFEVEDAAGGYDFYTSTGIDVGTLFALDVTETIDYGSIEAATTTASDNASTTVSNLGNAAIDIDVDGTDLSDGYSSTIPVANQKLATSTFNYNACITCTNLTATSTLVEVDLGKPVATTPVSDVIYWGIAVPFGVSSNPHTGQNTFYATDD